MLSRRYKYFISCTKQVKVLYDMLYCRYRYFVTIYTSMQVQALDTIFFPYAGRYLLTAGIRYIRQLIKSKN